MPCKWDKIKSAAIKRGAKVEKKEHPWATKKQARKIASDHVKKEGIRAYPKRKKK